MSPPEFSEFDFFPISGRMGLSNLVPPNTRYEGPEMTVDHQSLTPSPEFVFDLSHDDDKDSTTESQRSSILSYLSKEGDSSLFESFRISHPVPYDRCQMPETPISHLALDA